MTTFICRGDQFVPGYGKPLTDEERAILHVLEIVDGWRGVRVAFLAEACGHAGDGWWASKRIADLKRRGKTLILPSRKM